MRLIRQDRTSYISLQAHNTEDRDTQILIQKSSFLRDTEHRGTQIFVPFDSGQKVIKPKPGDDYRWCSGCDEWVNHRAGGRSGFGLDRSSKDGYDHYCKTCRTIQSKQHRLSGITDRLFRR